MSSFAVREHTLTVSDHPDADRLDVVTPDGTRFTAVSQKGRFKTGDSAIYVPEGAVVPERVLRLTGFWDQEQGKGMLAGPAGDVVKATRLRGVLSQGIFITYEDAEALTSGAQPKDGDWSQLLRIKKFVPEIPAEMLGKLVHVDGLRGYTDIENHKRYPDALQAGETVNVTEKLHGVCTVMSLLRDPASGDWQLHVSSKGTAKQGLALIHDDGNVYWRAAAKIDAARVLKEIAFDLQAEQEVTLFGETIGVQDLKYGLDSGDIGFRAFDLRIDGEYLAETQSSRVLRPHGVQQVPLIYVGPYDEALIGKYATGKTTVDATGKAHIREGVVVRPATERRDPHLGRVILKFINPAYLTRKGGTELE